MSPAQALPIPKTKEEIFSFREEKQKTDKRFENIFESFSKDSLKTIKESCDLARSHRKSYLSPWHLLSTLIQKKEIVSKFNQDSLNTVRQRIDKVFTDDKNLDYSGIVFFSPEIKKVFIAAYFISRQQSSNSVNNLYLLLSLSVYPEMQDLFSIINFSPDNPINYYMPKSMEEYATDLSNVAKTGTPVFVEREAELENIMRILARSNKHNVVLLGEEGVGKSILGMGLAEFLAKNKFPNFIDVKVISLDLGRLFLLSPLTDKTRDIVDEVGSLGKTVFFLDNANLLTNNVQISQLIDFLQNLEKRGSVYFILSTTSAFFKEYISENPYFSSFFEVIKIEGLSQDSTEKVLISESPRIEKFYKLKIDKPVFKEVAFLCSRYLPGSLPQKAISLLEEVCASVSLKKCEKVRQEDVKNIVSQKTGIPLNSLTETEIEKLKNLENLVGKYVIGQKEAIAKVSESLRRAGAGLKDQRRPIGSFLFLGPTGVGKTELAKTLAQLYFNDEKAFLRFDMSEYSESHTAQRLIGSPPGYVGYEEGGQLTNQVLERPYSLILFDEIEKAHPRVYDLFLQILDDGRLTDSQGRVVDFKNTLIIFTSNIASDVIFSHGKDLVDPTFNRQAFFEMIIMPIVREFFRPEFINRFDDIILFNPLNKSDLLEIAKIKIGQLKEKIKERNINFEISDQKLSEVVDSSYNPSFGARPLERAIKDQIENVVAKKMISGEVKEGETIKW